MSDTESLAQNAVERLSEDESLRGNLTDDGFNSLLEWAVNAAIAYAAGLKGEGAAGAMDQYASRLKGVLTEVVADSEAGKISDPSLLLAFEDVPSEEYSQKLASLKLSKDADANAIKITAILSNALTNSKSSRTDHNPAKKPESKQTKETTCKKNGKTD